MNVLAAFLAREGETESRCIIHRGMGDYAPSVSISRWPCHNWSTTLDLFGIFSTHPVMRPMLVCVFVFLACLERESACCSITFPLDRKVQVRCAPRVFLSLFCCRCNQRSRSCFCCKVRSGNRLTFFLEIFIFCQVIVNEDCEDTCRAAGLSLFSI